VYAVGGTFATVNDAEEIVPALVIETQDGVATTVPVIEQPPPESAGAKPLPVIVTVEPGDPEARLREMVGALTTSKVVEAESPVLPLT
jgi:hypothetical protein